MTIDICMVTWYLHTIFELGGKAFSMQDDADARSA